MAHFRGVAGSAEALHTTSFQEISPTLLPRFNQVRQRMQENPPLRCTRSTVDLLRFALFRARFSTNGGFKRIETVAERFKEVADETMSTKEATEALQSTKVPVETRERFELLRKQATLPPNAPLTLDILQHQMQFHAEFPLLVPLSPSMVFEVSAVGRTKELFVRLNKEIDYLAYTRRRILQVYDEEKRFALQKNPNSNPSFLDTPARFVVSVQSVMLRHALSSVLDEPKEVLGKGAVRPEDKFQSSAARRFQKEVYRVLDLFTKHHGGKLLNSAAVAKMLPQFDPVETAAELLNERIDSAQHVGFYLVNLRQCISMYEALMGDQFSENLRDPTHGTRYMVFPRGESYSPVKLAHLSKKN